MNLNFNNLALLNSKLSIVKDLRANYKFKRGVMLGKKTFLKSIRSAIKGWETWFIPKTDHICVSFLWSGVHVWISNRQMRCCVFFSGMEWNGKLNLSGFHLVFSQHLTQYTWCFEQAK